MDDGRNFGNIVNERGQLYVEWKIGNYFKQAPEENECWCSPDFHLADATWYLELYPNGHAANKYENYICLYLQISEPQSSLHVTFTLGIKANNGSIYKYRDLEYTFEGDGFGSTLVKVSEFLKSQSIVDAESFVTFFCWIRLPESCKRDAESQTSAPDDFSVLSRDIKNMFLSGNGSDVTFKVQDREFRAHSQILTARSPVFAPMLTHDMKEKNTGIVDVEDCGPDAFRELLVFLYSGQAETISSDNVIDLYCAAEKYDVKELKLRCSDFMKDDMSVDTFCDVMPLALKYEDTELIDYATRYFVKNAKRVSVTSKWISFVRQHAIEANELFLKALNSSSPDLK